MTLEEFVEQYDMDATVVLLEGKRQVAEDDKAKLTELAEDINQQN